MINFGMSRSRGNKRPVGAMSECPSPSKKRRTELNNELLMDSISLRQIKCPKKGDSTCLDNIEVTGKQFQKDIQPIIERNLKKKDRSKDLQYMECRVMRNTKFEAEYGQKRTEVRQQESISKDATGDQYGFLYAKTEEQVKDWCENGIQKGNVKESRIGNPDHGVTLSQYVDYVCQESFLPRDGWICIVKYFKGRPHILHESSTPFDPQPGYDCHVSNGFTTSCIRGLTGTYFSSQIYLYEFSDDSEFVSRPRQVLPYAAVRYRYRNNWNANHTRENVASLNRYRLALIKEREGLAITSAKAPIANRQHPDVPLVVVKPKPPPLINQTIRDMAITPSTSLLSKHRNRLSTGSSDGTSPSTPSAPGTAPNGERSTTGEAVGLRRVSTEKLNPSSKDALTKKCHSSQKRNLGEQGGNLQRQEDAGSEDQQQLSQKKSPTENAKEEETKRELQEKNQKTSEQQPPPHHPRQQQEQQCSANMRSQQRPDRPNKHIGIRHNSQGFMVAFFKLKAGDHFQAKMVLVNYAETPVYPLAVLSPKLSIRKFSSMARLRTIELADAKISIKEEFFCPKCNRFAIYYRIYLNHASPNRVEFSRLSDFMRKREVVGVVHFTNESQEMLIFPDGDFAKNLGIPPLDQAPTSSTHFMHCLLLSPQPKADYYKCILQPCVGPDNLLLDEVLATYIWADKDLPSFDESEAELLDSYGGEWPCEEAIEQMFENENEIQHNCLFRSLRRTRSSGEGAIKYQNIDFTRRPHPPSPPLPKPMEEYSTEMLKSMLNHVAMEEAKVREAQRSAHATAKATEELLRTSDAQEEEEEDEEEGDGDWRRKRNDIHCGVGSVLKSVMPRPPTPTPALAQEVRSPPLPQPSPICFSKRVFEEPPSSPCGSTGSCPQEHPALPENGESEQTFREVTRTQQPQTAQMTANLRQINVEINQILNVIKKSICLDPQRGNGTERIGPTTDQGTEPLRSTEDREAFNAYEMQNRAAQEARERVQPGLGPRHAWNWTFQSDSVDNAWTPPAGTDSSPSAAPVTEEEIHRVLDEGLLDCCSTATQTVERRRRDRCRTADGEGEVEDTRAALRRPPPSSPAPSPLVAAPGPGTHSPGLAARRDRRFLRKSALSSAVSSPCQSPSPVASSGSPPMIPPGPPAPSPVHTVHRVSRTSSMSISSGGSDAGSAPEEAAELENRAGSRIPVMVSRRAVGDEQQQQQQRTAPGHALGLYGSTVSPMNLSLSRFAVQMTPAPTLAPGLPLPVGLSMQGPPAVVPHPSLGAQPGTASFVEQVTTAAAEVAAGMAPIQWRRPLVSSCASRLMNGHDA